MPILQDEHGHLFEDSQKEDDQMEMMRHLKVMINFKLQYYT